MSQRIIIIGATSGMGRKLAEYYVSRGNRVGITGRRIELLQEIKQQSPSEVEYACFDVTANENISNIESLVNKLGGLDLLIIGAGTGEPSEELNWTIDKRTVETNVNGFVEIANWGFNYFIKQGYGHLAAISSIAAIRGNRYAPAYNASKAFKVIISKVYPSWHTK
jgi:NADP-dependent 3-hydroxy acid dehydrogenase YdfG